jgi:hypothetical protein
MTRAVLASATHWVPQSATGDRYRSIVRRRQTLVEESRSAVSSPIVVAPTLWLALIFASFGYNAPRNGMMVIVLLVCACKRPPTAWQYYAASL